MAKTYKHRIDFEFEGRRYTVKADTLDQLYAKKAEKINALKHECKIFDPKTTVRDWSKIAFDTYKSNIKRPNEPRYRYEKYIDPAIGMVPISKVTPVQCQGILNGCAGMSFSHVDKLRQELRFLFETALDNNLIIRNPAAKVKLPEYTKGTRRSITDHEREHLFKVYEIYKPFILFIVMLESGCRPAEAIRLIGKDIDHKNKLLHIRGTKTANSDRYVPITDTLYKEIKDTSPFAPVCPNSNHRQHTDESYKRLSARLRREMNISMGTKTYRNALIPPYALAEDFTPYCLRHTYCTDLCKAGVDVRTAQRLMGHANISITADIYTHVSTDEIKKAGDLINEYKKIYEVRYESNL